MTHGFHVAMIACAILAAAGGVLAWLTISDDVLKAEPARRGQPPVAVSCDYSCPVAGPPAPATALDQATGGGLPSALASSAGSQSHT